jgi:glycosyltransferase 2 family protein
VRAGTLAAEDPRRTGEPTDVEGSSSLTAGVAAAKRHLPRVLQPADPTEGPSHERSPIAVVRLVLAVGGMLLVEALARLLPSAHDGLQADLHARAGTWAGSVGRFADAVATGWSVLFIVIALSAAAITRHPRQLATSALAGAAGAATVAVFARIGGSTPGVWTAEEWQLATIAAAIAIGAASFAIFGPPIARWSGTIIGTTTILGVLGSEVSLASRVMLLLTGVAVGCAVAAAIGTTSRQVTRNELAAGLERSGLPVERLERHPGDARGSQPWRAVLATGRSVFVKVTADGELRADQLFRLWRRLRLREAGDERGAGSVRRVAEHEAFVAQRAQSAGVRTPTVIAVGRLCGDHGDRGVFTVFDAIEGETLDDCEQLTDPALRSAWSQIQVLRRGRIAHRDLRAANVLVAGNEAWIIDFGFAEVAADDELLERDLAEFLVSTAALVGPERAVDNAVAVLGADIVATAIPWVQPLAVSRASREALEKSEFGRLREMVRSAAGASPPELPQLQRVSWKGVLSVAALGVAVWVLLPQMAEGLDLDAVLAAHRGWMVAALVASALTYVGAAVSISGAVGGAAPLGVTVAAQVASSFTNRVTPARVGGMALNLRFLVTQGIEKAAAVTGIAVSTAAGTAAHVAITVIAVVWAGNRGIDGLAAPSPRVLVIAALVVALTVATVVAVPVLRRWCLESLVPAARRSARAFVDVISSPTSLVMVLGGSAVVTIMNVAAFGVSLKAFGESLPWATIAVVYLAGSAIASAAPTPGGLGATEAALVGGLVVVGVAERSAVPAVLLFRLATFWLPILPGWLAFTVMQRRGDL